jgi:hypothetical protein
MVPMNTSADCKIPNSRHCWEVGELQKHNSEHVHVVRAR